MWLPRQTTTQLGSRLLLQRWDELFSPQGHEGVRARYSTPFSLLEEAALVAGWTIEDPKWVKHLELVRTELRVRWESMQAGIVDARTRHRVLQLCAVAEPHSFQHSAQALSARLPRAETIALERLRALDVAHHKQEALNLLDIVGASYLRSGWQPDELNSLDNMALDSASTAEVIDAMSAMANPAVTEYQCIVFCSGDNGVIQSVTRDQNAHRARKAWLPTDGREPDDSFPLAWTIRSAHPGEAARQAAANTYRIFSVLSAYTSTKPVVISSAIFVHTPRSSKWVDLSDKPDLLQERRNNVQLTRGILAQEILDERIANALEQHRVATNLDEPLVRFVGHWSALEALAVLLPGKSVLDRVAKVVVPAVASRVLDRDVTYLAITLRYLGIGTRLTDVLPNSTRHHVAPEDVLAALVGPKGNPAVSALLSATAAQPLVCHRIFRLWEEMHDARSLSQRLRSSREKLGWHVARLYRARNRIVHAGERYPGLEHLGRHLQYYVQTLLGRVLHTRVTRPDLSLEAALLGVDDDLQLLCDGLSKEPSMVNVGDILPNIADALAVRRLYASA